MDIVERKTEKVKRKEEKKGGWGRTAEENTEEGNKNQPKVNREQSYNQKHYRTTR